MKVSAGSAMQGERERETHLKWRRRPACEMQRSQPGRLRHVAGFIA